jgi:spore maturation protein CgeB
VPGHIPFGPALDATLARHPVTIDVTSPGFSNTVSQKLFRGFDAGGFMLVDRKPDFVAAFGDLGEAISWRDGAELAAKIDLYLAKPTCAARSATPCARVSRANAACRTSCGA